MSEPHYTPISWRLNNQNKHKELYILQPNETIIPQEVKCFTPWFKLNRGKKLINFVLILITYI